MYPSRYDKYKCGTDDGSYHNRPEFGRDYIEVQHERHTGRNEKES